MNNESNLIAEKKQISIAYIGNLGNNKKKYEWMKQ